MILVFGGTTEGRRAVKVLEEAGTGYYYSTRSEGQDVELLNGQRLTGDMDVAAMLTFCQEQGIRLLVDAAHPFAEELHRNLLNVGRRLRIPVIRFDRIYPPHSDDATWCRDYDDAIVQMEAAGIDRLLALTGVNTIGRLRAYWEQHECWFRILNRQVSLSLARKNGFPEDHLVYYESDSTDLLLAQLRPQAILTKESGLSGGFSEKLEAARKAGVKVFVVERPAYPPVVADDKRQAADNDQQVTDDDRQETSATEATIVTVNGEHGLRRMVEKLLPEFYPLHSGLTTGTCATAAAVAATMQLLQKDHCRPSLPPEVPVILPNGETIPVAVHYADDYAYVVKDSGDDPDVTKGIEIRAKVEVVDSPSSDDPTIIIEGGEGIGRFTLPGFDFPPGEPAINRVPREMIRNNLTSHFSPLTSHFSPLPSPLRVTISAPDGEAIAQRTFNPRLGIEGGISVVGVSGIIKPFSEEAFIDSIRKCMQVAKASGSDRVVINSGAKSERYVKQLYPQLPSQAFVEYGNYIGETLRIASELKIPNITLGVMLGKAVKLAEGQLDTHSRKGTMNKVFIARMLAEAYAPAGQQAQESSILNSKSSILNSQFSLLDKITLARELWDMIPRERLQAFADVVISHCESHCRPLLPDGNLTILLITDEGTIYSATPNTAG